MAPLMTTATNNEMTTMREYMDAHASNDFRILWGELGARRPDGPRIFDEDVYPILQHTPPYPSTTIISYGSGGAGGGGVSFIPPAGGGAGSSGSTYYTQPHAPFGLVTSPGSQPVYEDLPAPQQKSLFHSLKKWFKPTT